VGLWPTLALAFFLQSNPIHGAPYNRRNASQLREVGLVYMSYAMAIGTQEYTFIKFLLDAVKFSGALPNGEVFLGRI
jgi:hypothetical protein